MKRPSPQFTQAMKDYERVAQVYGADSKQASMQLAIAMSYAPDDVQHLIKTTAKEMGLIPKPSGFSDEGEPLFTIEDIASHYGLSEQEVKESMERLDPTHAHSYKGTINRIQ